MQVFERTRARWVSSPSMRELSPGLWHWTARHARINQNVSSYYLSEERVLIDPEPPPAGLEWFEEHGRPTDIVLSNRHHDRDSWRFRERFGCTVHCVRNGIYELDGRGKVEPFDFGDELPGGIAAYEVDAICPDETALYIPAHRALACADGVVHRDDDGLLGFVPDFLMDYPEETKRGLRAAYARLAEELDFDHLLLAHGHPITGTGRDALREFAESG
jgi:glyoxylase-like metal-dependent hydrolase (beta-lactamase superfamily II)